MAEQNASVSGREDVSGVTAPEEAGSPRRLSILLAMAMFVLVVDTSVMNVSISAVVHDLHTTVSSVQSAIALEALVSAYWTVAQDAVSEWTAAAWCVTADEALGRMSPVDWVRAGNDPIRLATIARQDAARLAR